MIRNYSILSTNGELQTSPYIKKIESKYDLVVSTQKPQVVNFLFQLPVSRTGAKEVKILHDKDLIDISNVHVDCFHNQTLITSTIRAKDVGSFKISIYIPGQLVQSNTSYSAKKVPTR